MSHNSRTSPVGRKPPRERTTLTRIDYCTPIILWASAETGLTIWAASIPTLRILFKRMRSSREGTDHSSANYSSGKGRSSTRSGNNEDRSDPYYYMNDDMITLNDVRDDTSCGTMLGESGIKQTREILVTYEAGQSGSNESSSANRVDIFHH